MALTNEWQHIAMEPVYTTADQKGHEIQIAFLVGGSLATYAFVRTFDLTPSNP